MRKYKLVAKIAHLLGPGSTQLAHTDLKDMSKISPRWGNGGCDFGLKRSEEIRVQAPPLGVW